MPRKYVCRFFLLLPLISGCVSHNLEPAIAVDCTNVNTLSFSNDIQPIVNASCAVSGCHNGDNGAAINWTDPEMFQSHAAEASRRVRLPETHPDHMPRVGELTLEEITKIVCWAEQGAPINN